MGKSTIARSGMLAVAAGLFVAEITHSAGSTDATHTEATQWVSVGRTPDEQRFSPLTQINRDNVKRLGLAWFADFDTNALSRVPEDGQAGRYCVASARLVDQGPIERAGTARNARPVLLSCVNRIAMERRKEPRDDIITSRTGITFALPVTKLCLGANGVRAPLVSE
jgi:hypothetical protein